MDKNNKHLCSSPFNLKRNEEWVCEENEDGMCVKDIFNDNISFTQVLFCPYCGYGNKRIENGTNS